MEDEKKENNLTQAKGSVYRLFKYRPRSEQEIKDKLQEKNYSDEVISQTIQYFKNIELVDDRNFAKCWISSRLRKPFGAIRIKYELKAKGIDAEIIAEELKEAMKDYIEEAVADKLALTQANKHKNTDKIKVKHRVYNYLLRRGFTSGSALKAIQKI